MTKTKLKSRPQALGPQMTQEATSEKVKFISIKE